MQIGICSFLKICWAAPLLRQWQLRLEFFTFSPYISDLKCIIWDDDFYFTHWPKLTKNHVVVYVEVLHALHSLNITQQNIVLLRSRFTYKIKLLWKYHALRKTWKSDLCLTLKKHAIISHCCQAPWFWNWLNPLVICIFHFSPSAINLNRLINEILIIYKVMLIYSHK